MEQDDQICALCKWNKNSHGHFSCSHPAQQDIELRATTYYNYTCELYDEKDERKTMYDFLNKDFEK